MVGGFIIINSSVLLVGVCGAQQQRELASFSTHWCCSFKMADNQAWTHECGRLHWWRRVRGWRSQSHSEPLNWFTGAERTWTVFKLKSPTWDQNVVDKPTNETLWTTVEVVWCCWRTEQQRGNSRSLPLPHSRSGEDWGLLGSRVVENGWQGSGALAPDDNTPLIRTNSPTACTAVYRLLLPPAPKCETPAARSGLSCPGGRSSAAGLQTPSASSDAQQKRRVRSRKEAEPQSLGTSAIFDLSLVLVCLLLCGPQLLITQLHF